MKKTDRVSVALLLVQLLCLGYCTVVLSGWLRYVNAGCFVVVLATLGLALCRVYGMKAPV